MKLALAQLSPVLGDKEKNLDMIEKTVKDSDSDLVVFAELFLTGYMCKDNLTKLAEPLDGPSVKKAVKIAKEHNTHIVFGMPEKGKEVNGIFYNTSVLVYPDERVERYRKLHLANFGPFEEHLYFGTGNELQVFDSDFGKIGMLICFDCFFPEVAKIYALKGADILVCISASPSSTRIFFEKVIVARAIENAIFFTYTNLVGTELNMVYWGGNTVIGPKGDVRAKGEYFEEGIISCDIDLKDMSITREFRPTLRDTRMELFNELQRLLEKDVRGAKLD
ncbi:MAG: carbon-nitrogen hydrolase family protein [Methanomassiliicoccales archaeon]|nr:MAG: carbon-nitrogen hydrolase family protein [Methanomassiliicoccales archaeon]